MEYIYYKDPIGNFGDDLNGWLWPLLFGNESLDDDLAFLGIGSILYNENNLITQLHGRKIIVFGTGIRPAYDVFKYDINWDFKFLRGPLSSMHFQNKYEFIADAAYALRFIENFDSFKNVEKKYEVSVMPYFRSVNLFDWEKICENLGYHYISPLNEFGIEYTLNEIASSKCLISEAMHGAIVADILRVPWRRFVLSTPVTEGPMVSEFKWMDWLHSINLGSQNSILINFHRKTFLNSFLKKATGNIVDINFYLKNFVVEDIYACLSSINEYNLSSDIILNTIDDKLHSKVYEFKREIFI